MNKLVGAEYIGLLYDAFYQGKPLEIKSCEVRIKDSHAILGHRAGRVVFWDKQHEELLNTGGNYYLIIHEGAEVLRSKLVKAESLNLPEFHGMKAVSWKKLFRNAEAN